MSDRSNAYQYEMAEHQLPAIRSTCELSRKSVSDVSALLYDAARDGDPANMFMRMFYILSAIGQTALALDMQAKALAHRCVFRVTDPRDATLKLLAVAGPGDMRDNTPLDFLIEHADVRLDLLYVALPSCLPPLIPAHDVAFIALSAEDKHRAMLAEIAHMLERWPRPHINHPRNILNCARDRASALLQNIAGLHVPMTVRLHRGAAHQMASASEAEAEGADGAYRFPLTIRPVGAHRGEGLARVDDRRQLAVYLAQNQGVSEFYLSPFVDYRSDDGHYRKWRIALIDGKPFICHLAIGDDWIVHYAHAGMEASAEKRAEEAAAMRHFEIGFAARHRNALAAVAERLALDYVIIDCGETPWSELLFFEADTVGWVHATDPGDIFPYKQPAMQKVFDAFGALLRRKAGSRAMPFD
ncbi:RimK family alpha-L-glutamate ligase [Oxalobacteraceae bacterium CAVE-383]|nr:RimK family alpha-L-glutamate ligase [Oxalobacteraceae bacterium CAVE-383]